MNLFQYGEDSGSDSEGEKSQKGEETVIARSRFFRMLVIEKEPELPKKEVPVEKKEEQRKALEEPVSNISIVRKRQSPSEPRKIEEKETKIPKKEVKALPDPEEAKHWMAVLDSSTNKYYYWNQVSFPNSCHV